MHGSTAGWTPRGRLASRSKSDDVFLSMPISASVGLVGFTFGTPLLPTPREPARSGVWSSNFPSPASASILTACAYPITSSPSRWRAAKMACASAGRRRWWHGQPARAWTVAAARFMRRSLNEMRCRRRSYRWLARGVMRELTAHGSGVGVHSRARRWASVTCSAVICAARSSLTRKVRLIGRPLMRPLDCRN